MIELIEYATASTDGRRIAIVVYNDSWEEWIVLLWEDHKAVPEANYFTSNNQDAIDTAKRMVDYAMR